MSARIRASSNSAMVSASNFFLVRNSPSPVLDRPDLRRSKKVGGGGASPKVLMWKFSWGGNACQMRGLAAGDAHGKKGAIGHVADLHRGETGGAANAATLHQHHVA